MKWRAGLPSRGKVVFEEGGKKNSRELVRNLCYLDYLGAHAMAGVHPHELADYIGRLLNWFVARDSATREILAGGGIGRIDDAPMAGQPWIVGTPALLRYGPRAFWPIKRKFDSLAAPFDALYGFCVADNQRGLRLMQALGFTVGSPTWGAKGVRFAPVWKDLPIAGTSSSGPDGGA